MSELVPWYPGKGEIYENRKRIKGNAKENGKSLFDSKKRKSNRNDYTYAKSIQDK